MTGARPTKDDGPDVTTLCILRVAGVLHHEGRRHLAAMQRGTPLRLERQPTNPTDARAVALYWPHPGGDEVMVGYVPHEQALVVSPLLAAGVPLCAVLTHVDANLGAPSPLRFALGIEITPL